MSRAGSLICPILVGRDDLLDLADRRIGEAAGGRGGLLFLAGEAGIGKSRLLGAVRRKARAAGFAWANGSVAPQDHDVPIGLIGDLARTIKAVGGFGRLGDDLAAMAGDRDSDALGSRRLYVLDVVDRILAAVEGPTMLDFEDLQWADEISLEVVGELARRARDLPLLLVGAYRTEELPPGSFFREWRSRLIAQRIAEEARLAPLTLDQTALMTTLILDTGLPAPREVVAAVHARTEGFPLHIEELLGALPDDARTDGRKIRDADVPDTIEDAILVRIGKLSAEARAVAGAGAVIGRCFIPSVLAGIMDRQLAELDQPIQELIDRNVLYDAGDPGYVDFRHQVLRDVLYRTVPASELRKLHARAGEFGAELAGQKEIHASVHFERAGLRTQAYGAAVAGAEGASRISARQEAFELYRRAVENAPADLPDAELANLYTQYGSTAASIERNDVAIEAALRARDHFLRADDPAYAAAILSLVANAKRRSGAPTVEVRQLIEQGIREIADLPASPKRDEARLDLLSFLPIVEMDELDLDAAAATAQTYLELARAAGDRQYELDAEFMTTQIEAIRGQSRDHLGRLHAIAREARDLGFEATGVTAFRVTGTVAVRLMDYPAAEAALREGLLYADAIEQSHCRQQMATISAFLAWTRGRWDEAVTLAQQELVERGCLRGHLSARDVIGLVALGRGEFADAQRWLDDSLADGRAIGEIEAILSPLWGLAELAVVSGDPAAGLQRCEEAFTVALRSGDRPRLVPFVVTGVRAALAANRPDEAERWLATAREHLEGWTMAGTALDHGDGLVRLAAGQLASAREALERAVRGWEERGRIWEATWARLDLAQCQLRASRFGEAATLLGAARATAEALGSRPLIARADELARGRGSAEEPWRPLTAREFEVARLIAEGLTNIEIADRLTIAPKTASAHVEHILAKLGVTRRAEIAAWTATIVQSPAGPARTERVAVAGRA